MSENSFSGRYCEAQEPKSSRPERAGISSEFGQSGVRAAA
jgi:hypothetical protein